MSARYKTLVGFAKHTAVVSSVCRQILSLTYLYTKPICTISFRHAFNRINQVGIAGECGIALALAQTNRASLACLLSFIHSFEVQQAEFEKTFSRFSCFLEQEGEY